MGFFNKILKGLGFEDEEESKEKPVKIKQKKVKKNNVTATFNLDKYEDESDNIANELPQQNDAVNLQIENQSQKLSFEVVKVKNQTDVQNAVKLLSNGQMILLNVEQLSADDLTRSLDFITGAVFALNLKMQKIDEKIYLIQ